MPGVPTGTVTFLFTDIEGSTKLWERHTDPMKTAVKRHDLLMREGIERNGGYVFKTVGDAFCAAFSKASDALAAAIEAQHALIGAGEETGLLRVRMALHTGAAEEREGDYFGPPVNRVARLLIGHGGETLLSQATYELVRDVLPEGARLRDLGLHRLKDLSRPEHVFQVLYPGLPTDFPPLKSLDTQPNNLPQQLTSFIGREREMAEVKRLLTTTRLLTLTGAGGCGKTRLALQVAADLLEEYPDGVWFVDLAPLSDPALVPQSVASALGVREEPGHPLGDTLTAYLGPKSLLFVLDNCEHLVSACAHLCDSLLRACANLRILATSREVLGIGGETTWRLPSLASPDPEHLPSLERLTQYEAVRLFIDRAVAVLPTFTATNQNAPAVAQVCHRLDGIPLAIELAAARVKVLSVEQINARLEDRFRLLTGGSRTALPRQQTLRAAVDWGYELLSEKEQKLWQRLSVFAGGWTLEAAEAVCAGEGIEQTEVLDLLAQLVDKSLVLVDETAREGMRYRLLETIRQYGRERLAESGDAESVRRKHALFCVVFAEKAEDRLTGPEVRTWLDWFEAEHDNIRGALKWALEGDAEIALRLAGAMWKFWDWRGYVEEGRKWLEAVLASSDSLARTVKRAKTLRGAGWLASQQGDYAFATTKLAESLEIEREVEHRPGIVSSLNALGFVEDQQGDSVSARQGLEEALAIGRKLGDKVAVAASLNCLGALALVRGDHTATRAFYQESLAIDREVGHKLGLGICLHNLAQVATQEGKYALARSLLEEGLAIARELGNKAGIAWCLGSLGRVAMEDGDYALARSRLQESLAVHQELGNRRGTAVWLLSLGWVAAVQCDFVLARSLLEESLAIKRELGNRRHIAESLLILGRVASLEGNYGQARTSLEGSLALARELGNQADIGFGVWELGKLAYRQGDCLSARALCEEALAIFRELGNRGQVAGLLHSLGDIARREDDYLGAWTFYRESLSLHRELARKLPTVSSLESIALLAQTQGKPQRAAYLLGATEILRESMGAPLPPVNKAEYDETVAAVRDKLGEQAYQAAWAQGRTMTLEQAIAYALEEKPTGEAS